MGLFLRGKWGIKGEGKGGTEGGVRGKKWREGKGP